MKAQRVILVAIALFVVLVPSGRSPAGQDLQERSRADVRAVPVSVDEEVASPDVVDGEFDKALPLAATFKSCDGSVIELKGTCEIKGSIELFDDAPVHAAWVADVTLSGVDASTGMPYSVSFVRRNEFDLEDSNFDVQFTDALVASEVESIGRVTLRLKFIGGHIRVDSVKVEADCP